MRVLVTRPEPGATETAARLEALGHEPFVMPLTEIRPLAAAEAPYAADAVAVTSANALRHAPEALLAVLKRKPCFAVGDQTAAAAREAGFADVKNAGSDGAALARLIAAKFRKPAQITYLCGRVRRPEFETVLAANGLRVIAVETYDTVPLAMSPQAVRTRLQGRPVDAALVYSAEGARALTALLHEGELAQLFGKTRYFCLSARVAEALPVASAGRVTVSPEPSEASLLSLLGAGQAAKSFP